MIALFIALWLISPAQAQCLGFQCPPWEMGAGGSGIPVTTLLTTVDGKLLTTTDGKLLTTVGGNPP